MYSVILMLAVSAAPETQSFGGKSWGGHGCSASCGGCWSSCSGYGSSCHGWHKSHGSSCSGCGGCYGGCGGWSSCSGYGGCGGCYGGFGGNTYHYWSASAGNVTMYNSPSIMDSSTPFGCYGYGIYGGTSYSFPTSMYYAPATYGYGMPMTPTTPMVEEKKLDKDKTALPKSADRAEVVVKLPADAKLYANGQLTSLVTAERLFSSPPLEKGRDFEYSLKVEYAREGKTISDSQVVRVRAGGKFVAEFKDKAPVTEVLSTIKFVAPEGTRVFVEKETNALPSGSKEFKTPPLSKGVEYAYNFRAEVTKNGKNLTQSQRVVFKGGDAVTVDFMDIEGPRTASK